MGLQNLAAEAGSIEGKVVTTDVTAGDYVYEWGNNQSGWPKAATSSFGQNRYVAGASRALELFTTASRAATYGPMLESAAYPGATVNANTTTTAAASLSSYAGYIPKVATLTNGNFVSVYLSASTTLSAKIFDKDGAQVGSTLQLTTTCSNQNSTPTEDKFAVSGLSTGGYVVCFKNSSTSYQNIVVVSSANVITSGPFQISGASATTSSNGFSVAGDNNGGYLIACRNSSYLCTAYYNSSNTWVGGGTNVYNYNDIATGGTSGIYVQAFVLGNGAMGVATYLYGNVACSADYNWTFIHSLTTAGNHATSVIFNQANQSDNRGLGVAVSVSAPSRGMIVYRNPSYTDRLSFAWFTISSAGGSISFSVTDYIAGVLNQQTPALIAKPDGTFTAYYFSSAAVINRQDVSETGFKIGSPVAVYSSVNTDAQVSVCPLAYKAAISYSLQSNHYPTQQITQTETLTNGGQIASATTYTPSGGYYLAGIALETVSAGNACKIGTRGAFALGAGYSSATAYYDYAGSPLSASNLIKGNAGFTSGTTVTLEGLK